MTKPCVYQSEPNRVVVQRQCLLAICLAILTCSAIQFGLSMLTGHSIGTGLLQAVGVACLVGLIMARILRQPVGLLVVSYQGISDTKMESLQIGQGAVRPEALARHLRLFRRMGLKIVNSQTLVQTRLTGGAVPKEAVSLHFGTLERSSLTLARPILKQHGAHATLFVSAQDVAFAPCAPSSDVPSGTARQRNYATWSDLREWDAEGVFDVEARWAKGPCVVMRSRANTNSTWLHSSDTFRTADADDMRSTLEILQTTIQREMGRPATLLCWSGHKTCSHARTLAQESGFQAMTCGDGRNQIDADPAIISSLRLGQDYGGFACSWLDELTIRAEIRCFQGYIGWSVLLAAVTTLRRLVTLARRLHQSMRPPKTADRISVACSGPLGQSLVQTVPASARVPRVGTAEML
jgi:hypothetical protein